MRLQGWQNAFLEEAKEKIEENLIIQTIILEKDSALLYNHRQRYYRGKKNFIYKRVKEFSC